MEIVDPTTDAGDLDAVEKELSEAVTAANAKAKADATDDTQEQEAHEADIPEKYRGKSLEDIIEMHRNLESQYGRMANDLGQQRKLTDRLLDLKRTDDLEKYGDEPKPKRVEVSSSELLDNPTEALEKVLSQREAAIRADYEQRMAQLEAGLAQERFVQKHPDYDAITADPKFAEWLQSSVIRQQAAQQAYNGNYAVADALLSEFKAQTQTQEKTEKSTAADEKAAARAASLESSSQSTGQKSGGKVYRRADLIRLKVEKPSVYEDPQFQEEILRAYSEGRVK
jgi:hypothetical protein